MCIHLLSISLTLILALTQTLTLVLPRTPWHSPPHPPQVEGYIPSSALWFAVGEDDMCSFVNSLDPLQLKPKANRWCIGVAVDWTVSS